MRRVAIPIVDGRLSEYLWQCDHYEIYELINNQVIRITIEDPTGLDIESLPEWAAGLGITEIIANKIDRRIILLFALYKIHLFVGIEKGKPEDLIDAYLSSLLQSDTKVISEIMASDA